MRFWGARKSGNDVLISTPDAMDVDQDTFIVGRHKLSAGETLSPDLSTYEMLHSLDSPWPCLSCDVSAWELELRIGQY